ncbi:uncharacterized protein SPPG_01899 [Spizellomyces punctatus DAOM BR117]|uniref:RRM domain-containing protein n=1 Tax=Spizellomyces punctatus (strain DAOM BR117) TaxID=645134 RepID=A0A0L0HNZ8_SPIPD|nr:uncharacterized protein SPPG_01899 [Spizellomyces punctatus DAOM BR117]KND02817.1 hypothetical protein SPPG_01899 [Spizellomyces punctatus DAOM BR117]|eukprot:XP_016610856.1 hypothetical protein SPPG_01899 [Spizellomyces punctatus DAOM BR117]
MSGRPTRVVFVGNIPYDLTEPQLIDIFKEVGPVVSFRLVFDRETGKPKGYGFCTFQDAETAASAVRNLNSYDVGGRQLRIDFAESDKEDSGGAGRAPPPDDRNRNMPQPTQMAPPTVIPGQSSTDVINKTLSSYPPEQMLEVLSQMKFHVQSNPDQVRALLTENPQLSYSLFQALLVMNVVEPAIMQRILQSQAIAPQQRLATSVVNPPFIPATLPGAIPPGAVGHFQTQPFVPPNPQLPVAVPTGLPAQPTVPVMPTAAPQIRATEGG